jgi:hypothetical protein
VILSEELKTESLVVLHVLESGIILNGFIYLISVFARENLDKLLNFVLKLLNFVHVALKVHNISIIELEFSSCGGSSSHCLILVLLGTSIIVLERFNGLVGNSEEDVNLQSGELLNENEI